MPPGYSKLASCHNCRRRRLRCDRSWPGCHKCALAGHECLGYGKVFVWTQAIDHHGRLRRSPAAVRSRAPFEVTAEDSTTTTTRSTPTTTRLATPTDAATGPGMSPTGSASPDPPDPSGPDRGLQEEAEIQVQIQPQAYASLTDPLFQDLDRNSRYYLAHFADRVCKDLVARDAPGANPFRELIPLTRRHPLLLQVLVATSAIHWSNIRPIVTSGSGIIQLRVQVGSGLSEVAAVGCYLARLRSQDLVSRQALIDALIAKQKAMAHLQAILDTLDPADPAGSEVALAATHFFIKFDLIDLDKREGRGWRAHLQGSSSILGLLTSHVPEKDSSLMLRDCVIADCFIYHVLGSTLASGKLAANIARYALDLIPVMKRVEVNSYLSFPPELLHILLQASQLSYELPSTTTSPPSSPTTSTSLLDAALAFDIPAWAARLHAAHPNLTDAPSRIHIASAHRAALCLYILQALPTVRALRPLDTDALVADILGHLAHIGGADPYFKATSWPTFIAGAQVRDEKGRVLAMTRLLGIWDTCPWGYIFTAIEMLKVTWDMQDAARAGGEIEVNWLQGLKGMGYDCLIV